MEVPINSQQQIQMGHPVQMQKGNYSIVNTNMVQPLNTDEFQNS